MDLDKLANRIINYGQFIETIEYYNRRISLYSVENDFYEVAYNQFTNDIEKVNQATEEDLLKYLNRIKLKL